MIRTFETVHAQRPLIGDQAGLGDRQEPEGKDESQGRPDHRVQPDRRLRPEFLGQKHQSSDDMAHDEDRDIGRRVIGAMMEEFLAAIRATIVHFEIGLKYLPFSTGRTGAAQALANGIPNVPGRRAILELRAFIYSWRHLRRLLWTV